MKAHGKDSPLTKAEKQIMIIKAEDRVLLLPHCLRRQENCHGKYTQEGLQCLACNPDCHVNILRTAAIGLGYKGICVAPGGRLALNYVKEKAPKAVVAVACSKELQEGVEGVRALASLSQKAIPVVIIPLTKDGCIDTEVDIQYALERIGLGCTKDSADGGS